MALLRNVGNIPCRINDGAKCVLEQVVDWLLQETTLGLGLE